MRTWRVRMTSFWLFSVVLCLTGLGLGDSSLVILSLCSLALSCVFSIFYFLFPFPLSFPFVFFSLPYVFLHKVVFFNIYLFIYQKYIYIYIYIKYIKSSYMFNGRSLLLNINLNLVKESNTNILGTTYKHSLEITQIN